MARVIDGDELAEALRAEIEEEVSVLRLRRPPWPRDCDRRRRPSRTLVRATPAEAGREPRLPLRVPARRLRAFARRGPVLVLPGETLVIVGRSTSVGKPLAFLGLQRDATVVMCHSKTFEAGELADYTRRAHILIAAAGEPGLIHGDMVQDGVVAVDVGTNAVQDSDSGEVFLTGDLDLPSVSAKAEAITPVPGGVGPITDVWLIGNVLAAAAMSAHVEPRFGALITGRLLGNG